MRIKEKIVATTEKIYYLARNNNYDIKINLFAKNSNTKQSKKIQLIPHQTHAHTRKWQAKNK